MSLLEKSNENLNAAEHFIKQKKNYNVVASRVYYAVFQRMKYYLISNKFNYDDFVKKNYPGEPQKKYSHGTIIKALTTFLFENRDKFEKPSRAFWEDLTTISLTDSLYKSRRNADYEDKMIQKEQANENYSNSQKIINILDFYL